MQRTDITPYQLIGVVSGGTSRCVDKMACSSVQNSLHNFMQTTYTGCLKKNARSCLKPDISRLEAQILTSKDSFDIVMFSAFK